MIARFATWRVFPLLLCFACQHLEAGESGEPTTGTMEGSPMQGQPCEVEHERRCDPSGLGVYTCELTHWTSQTCRSICIQRAEPSCSLGCLITAEGEDCLCFPSTLPCE